MKKGISSGTHSPIIQALLATIVLYSIGFFLLWQVRPPGHTENERLIVSIEIQDSSLDVIKSEEDSISHNAQQPLSIDLELSSPSIVEQEASIMDNSRFSQTPVERAVKPKILKQDTIIVDFASKKSEAKTRKPMHVKVSKKDHEPGSTAKIGRGEPSIEVAISSSTGKTMQENDHQNNLESAESNQRENEQLIGYPSEEATDSQVNTPPIFIHPPYLISTPPSILEQGPLNFPESAEGFTIDKTVIVSVFLNSDGQFVNMEIAKSGGRDFDEAAIDMIIRSSFSPARVGELTVPCATLITFNFKTVFEG